MKSKLIFEIDDEIIRVYNEGETKLSDVVLGIRQFCEEIANSNQVEIRDVLRVFVKGLGDPAYLEKLQDNEEE